MQLKALPSRYLETQHLGMLSVYVIDREAYAYRIQAGDGLELVASNLGQLIQTKRPVAVRGFTVTVPAAGSIVVRSVHDAAASSEIRRQEKDIRIICWCPTPTIRDAVASTVDAAINQRCFLSLPDGTDAHVMYRNTGATIRPKRPALQA